MRQLIITRRASDSLLAIAQYYTEEFGTSRAEKVIKSIREIIFIIPVSPFSFRICYDVKYPNPIIRQAIVHKTFKIIYRVSDDSVQVLEVFHVNRNPNLLRNII